MVAFKAARNDVVPSLTPALDGRYDVIKRQVLRGALGSAVLASVQIPGIDVRPAELDVLEAFAHAHVSEESKHARHFDGETNAPDFVIIFRQHLHFALEEQGNRALPGNYIDWLIAGVENECLFHRSLPANNY